MKTRKESKNTPLGTLALRNLGREFFFREDALAYERVTEAILLGFVHDEFLVVRAEALEKAVDSGLERRKVLAKAFQFGLHFIANGRLDRLLNLANVVVGQGHRVLAF